MLRFAQDDTDALQVFLYIVNNYFGVPRHAGKLGPFYRAF
jgi:hypothetical protein